MFCLTRELVQLNYDLELPALIRGEVCHGYQNCCECSSCRKRAKRQLAVRAPAQPWEPKRAA